jgi:ketosteroid isomerase-like protein
MTDWSGGVQAQHSESAQVEAVIRASIGWAEDKDLELLYNSLVQDESLFIFHPNDGNTISGFDAFRRMAETVFMSPAFKATGFEIRDLRIGFSRSGTVACCSARLDDRGEWDGRPIGRESARWTGVLEKRERGRRIAQMHFSLPAD